MSKPTKAELHYIASFAASKSVEQIATDLKITPRAVRVAMASLPEKPAPPEKSDSPSNEAPRLGNFATSVVGGSLSVAMTQAQAERGDDIAQSVKGTSSLGKTTRGSVTKIHEDRPIL